MDNGSVTDGEDVGEAASASASLYPPINCPSLGEQMKKYSEMKEPAEVNINDCDVVKLQWELENLLVESIRRKQQLVELEAGGKTPAVVPIKSSRRRWKRSNKANKPFFPVKLEASATAPESREDPDKITRENFEKFVHTYCGPVEVRPEDLLCLDEHWHANGYDNFKNKDLSSIIRGIDAGFDLGFMPKPTLPNKQDQDDGGPSSESQTKKKPDPLTKHVYNLRRDNNSIQQLEKEVAGEAKSLRGLKLDLVNPDKFSESAPCPVQPPTVSPFLLPSPPRPKKVYKTRRAVSSKALAKEENRERLKNGKISAPGTESVSVGTRKTIDQQINELEIELELIQHVNAITLMDMKYKALLQKEYFALDSPIEAVNKEEKASDVALQRVIKSIAESQYKKETVADADIANLNKLKEDKKKVVQSRNELVQQKKSLFKQLYP